ncbi:unnamed protein product [Victoria cruziana]
MDCHYVREEVLMKNLELAYVSSEFQLGDFFTKSLPSPRFHMLLGKLSKEEIGAGPHTSE